MVLKPNSLAPQFKAQAIYDGEFTEVSMSDYKGKYLIVFFYPLDFTFVCPTEIIAFSQKAEEFKKRGVEVLGISCDSAYSHFQWTSMERHEGGVGQLNFPLVSDFNKEISRSFEILDEEEGTAYRGLYLIDKEQKIRCMMINDNPVGRSVDEALRLVDALQFTDIHGEVCPVNWQKGQDTIVPEAKESKKFFNKTYD
ncbi:Peroxiredoxin-2 [Zancudomyces culisetae]|uniref:thioredoxin-dependent peroxiredoxin n=1 Tax=Zancudomyces culisetae TaxID=1213189 RepID=A0A1R1PQF4_ZANCU|nr:Peroxiredoxin-2 [Zancudomyces culisetae]|eukprot:OMH83102.1 Peroxiredoxin-2 [Zancudomyces culisetae]